MVKGKTRSITLRMKEELVVDIDLMTKNGEINRTYAIETSLERYFLLLENAYREVRKEFTQEEKAFILEMLNGSHYPSTNDSYRQLWIRAEEAIKYKELDEKWKVDGAVLIEKLRNLPAHKCLAIVDRAEKFWEQEAQGGTGDVWLVFDGLR